MEIEYYKPWGADFNKDSDKADSPPPASDEMNLPPDAPDADYDDRLASFDDDWDEFLSFELPKS